MNEGVVALAKLGEKDAAKDIETVLLKDSNPGVRMTAAFWLGGIKNPQSAAALSTALQTDSDPNVRAQAARSLIWLGTSEANKLRHNAKNDTDARVRKVVNE